MPISLSHPSNDSPPGTFFPLDSQGFVCNPCDGAEVLPPWRSLVAALAAGCEEILGDRRVGLYLRGSVPRGRAVPYLSDLDSFVLARSPDGGPAVTPAQRAALDRLERDLGRRYPFCARVEIDAIAEADFWRDAGWQATAVTQSWRVLGLDLRPRLAPVKPGPALVAHAWTIDRDLAETRAALRSPADLARRSARARCGGIARRLVRTGFELVMEREGRYTRDLGLCCDRFGAYYPDRAGLLCQALDLALRPSGNRAGLLVFLQKFEPWLAIERDRWLPLSRRP